MNSLHAILSQDNQSINHEIDALLLSQDSYLIETDSKLDEQLIKSEQWGENH